MDIVAAIDEYLACKKNPLTHDSHHWYEWMLGVFEKWCAEQGLQDLSEITAVHVQQFVSANPQFSDNTKHHRAQIVKGFLRWCAVDDDLGVREKMVKRIEMPKVKETEVEIYSPADIKRLLAGAEQTKHPLRNRAVLLLLLDTGIRAAELCYDSTRPEEETGLLFEHVVLGKRGAESYVIVMGKGRKTRTVKFGDETRLAIRRYLDRERPRVAHEPYLFLAQGNTPLTVRSLQQFLKRLESATGVHDVYAHRFRHTFAIQQLLCGTSAFVLMQLMGHSSLESTKIYTRALSQMQARAASVSVVDEMRRSSVRRNGPEQGKRGRSTLTTRLIERS